MNESEPTKPGNGTSARNDAVSVSCSSPFWPFTAGIPLLLIALFFQTVTIAGGSYLAALVIALFLTAVADTLFIFAFRRGGIFARSLSVLCLLPTLFVVADLLRRAPYLFTR